MGIFWRAGSRTHSCVRHRCVECRAGTNIFLVICWCGWRDSTDFLSFLALFGVCLCDWTGGEGGGEGGGGAGQYDFSVILFFYMAGRYN